MRKCWSAHHFRVAGEKETKGRLRHRRESGPGLKGTLVRLLNLSLFGIFFWKVKALALLTSQTDEVYRKTDMKP